MPEEVDVGKCGAMLVEYPKLTSCDIPINETNFQIYMNKLEY